MSGEDALNLCFTNSSIWLYTFIEQQDSNKAEIARQLIENNHICLSSQVVNEICSNLF